MTTWAEDDNVQLGRVQYSRMFRSRLLLPVKALESMRFKDAQDKTSDDESFVDELRFNPKSERGTNPSDSVLSALLEFGPPRPDPLVDPLTIEVKTVTSLNAADKLGQAMSDHPFHLMPSGSYIRVFTARNLIASVERISRDRDRLNSFFRLVRNGAVQNGYRSVLSFSTVLEKRLLDLRSKFLNFVDVIDCVIEQMSLWEVCAPEERRIYPMLLEGPAGCGKSFFCEQLAAALGVDFNRIDCGSISAGMSLAGSTSQWSGAQPGIILEKSLMMTSASPMWFLDEINLLLAQGNSPAMPVLLGMLEPHTARKFRDEYCGIEFDLSRSIFIAACNDTFTMSDALLSRFKRFKIKPAGLEQRKIVAQQIFEKDFPTLQISDSALTIIAKAEVDLRDLKRILHKSTASFISRRRNLKNPSLSVVGELDVKYALSSSSYQIRLNR